ncbi:MAG: hypothetical protein Q4E88_00890 [Coriobacteriia bacterium]|nr:hypothetical protein [Coriobacteriia bacterium]
MNKLKNEITNYFNEIGSSDEVAKKAYRAAQVQNLYKEAIKHVYGDSAFLVLEKTNAVYIMNENDKKKIIIYTCDSMVHADLDSKQEFIKMWLGEHGEIIDKFELLASKLGMRRQFPYKEDVAQMKKSLETQYEFLQIKNDKQHTLTQEEIDSINLKIDKIDNKELKKALKALIK